MLVKGEVTPFGVQAACDVCGEPVGHLTFEEVIQMSRGGYGPILCFECEGLEVELVPDALVPSDKGECIVIGKKEESHIRLWFEPSKILPPFMVEKIGEK